jgi:hypothetical protein
VCKVHTLVARIRAMLGEMDSCIPSLASAHHLSVISYPRLQQLRRLGRAVAAVVGAVVTGVLTLARAAEGVVVMAGILVIATVGLAACARHWIRLAGRSRLGASSERQVHDALELLRIDGWRVRHSLRWHGGGDIDHVAITPRDIGLAFAIETKTKTYRSDHVAHAAATARRLAARRRRWCPRGALAVHCVVRARGIERVEGDVLVVSIDRLPAALRCVAGTQTRPAFLAATPPRA